MVVLEAYAVTLKRSYRVTCLLQIAAECNVLFFLQECVRGALKTKTILLVTHQVDFLHNVDNILVS